MIHWYVVNEENTKVVAYLARARRSHPTACLVYFHFRFTEPSHLLIPGSPVVFEFEHQLIISCTFVMRAFVFLPIWVSEL